MKNLALKNHFVHILNLSLIACLAIPQPAHAGIEIPILSSAAREVGKVGNNVARELGKVSPDLGYVVRESLNVFLLGAPGLATDHERAEAENREAEILRRVAEGRRDERVISLRQLIIDQYEAYSMTKENAARLDNVYPNVDSLVTSLESFSQNLAKWKKIVRRIQEEHSEEEKILRDAEEFSENLKEALTGVAQSRDLVSANNFYAKAFLRSRKYGITTQRYISLLLAKTGVDDVESIEELQRRSFHLIVAVQVIRKQLSGVSDGLQNQQNHHYGKMKSYMAQLEALGERSCGISGLPPCN